VTDASTQAAICPACSRRVPRRVAVCRCGFRLAAVYDTSSFESSAVDGRDTVSGRWIPTGLIIAGLGLVAVGICYLAVRRTDGSPTAAPVIASPSKLQGASAAPPRALSARPPTHPNDPPPRTDGTPATSSSPGTLGTPGTPGTPGTLGTPGTPGTLEDVISQAMPAVVSIETTTARGSGFFINAGLVVTNAHVVEANTFVTVRLAGGKTLNARVTTASTEYDLALVRVDSATEDQSVLQPRSAQEVRVGQEVIAIGSALGVLQNTVTRGIISAVRRAGSVMLLQTDAAINPGNSGGPLLDRHGRVVGVTTMKIGQSAESIGFAVAIDHALPLVAGKRPTSASSAPALVSPQTFRPNPRSAVDDAREAGARAFDRTMQALRGRADQIDEAWTTFRRRCSPRARSASGDREWFGVWDDRAGLVAPAGDCAAWLDEIVQAANQIRSAMVTADELARRAEVYPGVRRDLRRRHRLDWTGWER
jgi:Trypsin-like peptidase domain